MPSTAEIGSTVWVIADALIPEWSEGPGAPVASLETACFLNASDRDAHVSIMTFFRDSEPIGPYSVKVPARRMERVRFNDFTEPAPIPHDINFACVIESDQPIVVQQTRLDARHGDAASITTIAYPVN